MMIIITYLVIKEILESKRNWLVVAFLRSDGTDLVSAPGILRWSLRCGRGTMSLLLTSLFKIIIVDLLIGDRIDDIRCEDVVITIHNVNKIAFISSAVRNESCIHEGPDIAAVCSIRTFTLKILLLLENCIWVYSQVCQSLFEFE